MTDSNQGAKPPVRMHADEIFTDAALVVRLIAVQFPLWAGMPVTPVHSDGTDNAIYRLGEAMAVRMPRRAGAVTHAQKDARWLPHLAPRLPVAIPTPLATGEPGEGYPWPWAVCSWLEGAGPDPAHLTDPHNLARDLAAFIRAMRAIEPSGGPKPGVANSGRGLPLALRDSATRDALAALHDMIDVAAATAAWDAALRAPVWSGPPRWIHGDLNAGNLLVTSGRLCGVIDFGCLGVGDPACDLLGAWYLFDNEARATFRAALAMDDASWARGRGWALSMALIALPYYRQTSPAIVAGALRAVREVLDDHQANGPPADR
jgi:aminoglycoside phosphotransferase (APT) family kinase protein